MWGNGKNSKIHLWVQNPQKVTSCKKSGKEAKPMQLQPVRRASEHHTRGGEGSGWGREESREQTNLQCASLLKKLINRISVVVAAQRHGSVNKSWAHMAPDV